MIDIFEDPNLESEKSNSNPELPLQNNDKQPTVETNPPVKKKTKKKKITLTHPEILRRSHETIYSIQELSFYDKTVFFTSDLKSNPLFYYQLVGNRGGHSEYIEMPTDTDIAVISDKIIKYLEMDLKHHMIDYLEMRLNNNNKLKIFSESAFLTILEQRESRVNEKASLNLLYLIRECSKTINKSVYRRSWLITRPGHRSYGNGIKG